MAKIIPIEIIASMSGKVCSHSDMYFSVNKQTGVIHTGKICNPSTAEPTAKQLEVRQKFTERRKLASAWMTANKPTDALPKGTELYQQALANYKSQHKIGSFFGYIASVIDADGNVALSGSTTGTSETSQSSTDNANENQNSGGSTDSGDSTSGGTSTGGGDMN